MLSEGLVLKSVLVSGHPPVDQAVHVG